MTEIEARHYPAGRSVVYGLIGGVVGGAVMYGVMSAVMIAIGMGGNCFAIIMGMITGQPYDAALGPGIAVHFATSIAIGAIFGAVTSIGKLRITGFGKGIGLGAATGVIAYLVIFLPLAMTVIPPHMMDLMKTMPMTGSSGMAGSSGMNEKSGSKEANQKMMMEEAQKMMMEELPKMQSMILVGSFVGHISYGVVLGAIVTALIMRKAIRRYGR